MTTTRLLEDLVLECGGCTLRPPTEDEVSELAWAASAPGAVLPAEDEHFVTWLAGKYPEEIARERMNRVRAARVLRNEPGWALHLVIVAGGEPVGMQSLTGFDSWPAERIVGTASWLLAPYQRRGIGTRARAAVLELAFAHLSADAAKSWVLERNDASRTVSEKLGYEVVDRHELLEGGERFVEEVHRVDRPTWLRSSARTAFRPTVIGAAPLRDLLGAR